MAFRAVRTGQAHRTLVGHTGPVTCVQFDELHLVSGSLDKSIRVSTLGLSSPSVVADGAHRSGTCERAPSRTRFATSTRLQDSSLTAARSSLPLARTVFAFVPLSLSRYPSLISPRQTGFQPHDATAFDAVHQRAYVSGRAIAVHGSVPCDGREGLHGQDLGSAVGCATTAVRWQSEKRGERSLPKEHPSSTSRPSRHLFPSVSAPKRRHDAPLALVRARRAHGSSSELRSSAQRRWEEGEGAEYGQLWVRLRVKLRRRHAPDEQGELLASLVGDRVADCAARRRARRAGELCVANVSPSR